MAEEVHSGAAVPSTGRVRGVVGRVRRATRAEGAGASGLAKLMELNACGAAADALVAVSLAGSLFFSISPDAARGRVALYLLLTMAPFAVVAPLIGPFLDRREGGRRAMVIGSAALRALLCLLMAKALHSLLLFPEAFALLV